MQVNNKGKLQISYNAPVILTFALISTLALVLSNITKGSTNYYLFSVYRSSPTDILGYIRVFTHVLGHSDFQHFYGNMLFLLLLGPILEEKYGSINMFRMIVITSFVTGIYNVIFNQNVMLLGASGIVFMLILLISIVNIEERKIPLTFILVLVMYLGEEVMLSFTTTDNVARFAHIIGGICGAVLGFLLDKSAKMKGKGRYGRN